MDNIFRLSETQQQIMEFFWGMNRKISCRELQSVFNFQMNKDWKIQTVNTHLTRLVAKNFLITERVGKFYVYFPTMTKEEYKLARTIHMINFHYDSVKDFVKILVSKNYVDKNDVLQLIKDYL